MNCKDYSLSETEIQKAIANSFINLRKKNNLTQEKLAEILDVSIEHISRVENCKYTCSITLIFKICSYFDITLDDFFNIYEPKIDSKIHKFIKNLSLEKRETLINFFEEIQNTLK